MSKVTNRKRLNEENSEFSDNSQTYDSGMLSECVNSLISSKNEEHDCSDNKRQKAAHGQKQGLVFY